MKTMKSIFLILGLITISTSFNACGGSSSSTATIEENTTNTEAVFEKIPVDVNCSIPPTIAEYLEVLKGDKIEEVTSNSSIKLYHDENNVKKVCLLSGEVLVVRAIEK